MSNATRSPLNPNVRHEESDFRLAPIVWFFVWLTAGLMITAALVGGILWFLLVSQAQSPAEAPALEESRALAPQLQPYPPAHWQQMKKDTDRHLSSYGWVNRSEGTVRIPIDRAMDLLVERGLPPLSTMPDSPLIPPVKSGPTIPPPVSSRSPLESGAPDMRTFRLFNEQGEAP